MKITQSVRSTREYVPSIEVNKNRYGMADTVYIRSNIKRVEEVEFSGWEYDEIEYTIHEYLENLTSEEDSEMLALMVSMLMSEVDMLTARINILEEAK